MSWTHQAEEAEADEATPEVAADHRHPAPAGGMNTHRDGVCAGGGWGRQRKWNSELGRASCQRWGVQEAPGGSHVEEKMRFIVK